MKKVIIVGGGLSGLTCAHILVNKGYEVTIVEKDIMLGGKMMSWRNTDYHNLNLPVEHGFRFYFNFYLNLFKIMKEINVYDNLEKFISPLSISYISSYIFSILKKGLDIYGEFIALLYFANLVVISKMRYDFLNYINLNINNYFTGYTDTYTYQTFIEIFEGTFATNKNTEFLNSLTWYMKYIFYNKYTMMCGETSKVFIDIWEKYLLKKGAMIMRSTELESIKFNDNKIDYIIAGSGLKIHGDEFIMAITNDDWKKILDKNILNIVPSLGSAFIIPRVWQNGVSIYINKTLEQTDESIYVYIEKNIPNPWKLAWKYHNKNTWKPNLDNYFNEQDTAKTIISISLSNWTTPGLFNKKTAMECSPNEIINEIIQQLILLDLVKDIDVVCLNNQNISWNKNDLVNTYGIIDKAIVFDNGLPTENNSTLVATNKDTFKFLPNPSTNIENMYLASSWISRPGFATFEYMEGACAGAIYATNCLLEKYNDSYPLLILGENVRFINTLFDNPIGYVVERLIYLLEVFDRIFLYPLAFILKYFNLI